MTRPRAAFLLSVLAIWMVSSAVDPRYSTWGADTAAVILFVAALECLAAFAVFAAALKHTGGGREDLFL